MVVARQVTALGLINAAGKTGDVPTGVQFALKGQLSKTVSSSVSLITQCWQERWRLTDIPCHRMRQCLPVVHTGGGHAENDGMKQELQRLGRCLQL